MIDFKRAASFTRSFKASETLLGIETGDRLGSRAALVEGFKASETLLGIETDASCSTSESHHCFKASETLLGIETVST